MRWIDSLLQDFRFGFRMLHKNPAPALAALGALFGACTAAFSLIDAFLLRPLPVAAQDRLVAFSYPAVIGGRSDGENFSCPAFRRFREAAGPYADPFGGFLQQRTRRGRIRQQRIRTSVPQLDLRQRLRNARLPPALGRTLYAEDGPHGDSVVFGLCLSESAASAACLQAPKAGLLRGE